MYCVRCGGDTNRSDKMCASCSARPARVIITRFGKCRPHRGAFDSDDNPLDRFGHLYRPGLRVCGFRDCISLDHVWDPIEWERINPSYRLAREVTLAQYVEMLENERSMPPATRG